MIFYSYILLLFSFFCFISAYFTFKKGHPFSLLALVIFNCGLLCLSFSGFPVLFDIDLMLFSSLLFPIGFLVFFKNLHTRKIGKWDKFLLGIASIEYILQFYFLVIYYFASNYFLDMDTMFWFLKIFIAENYVEQWSGLMEKKPLKVATTIILYYFFCFCIILFPITFYQIFKELNKAKRRHLNFFTADSFYFYRWNYFLFSLIFLCFLIVGIIVLYDLFIGDASIFYYLVAPSIGISGLLLGIFSYISPKKLGREPDFSKLLNHLQKEKLLEKPEENTNKYEDYKQQLTVLLEKEKIYQDPNLNLATLAERMDISTRHLSRIINKGYNKSFSSFINQYRVADVQQKLFDSQFEHYAILSLGLEAGFNSKSSFYTAFKKETGLSPVQFKKNNKLN